MIRAGIPVGDLAAIVVAGGITIFRVVKNSTVERLAL
jgi:hypothetical protein